MLLPLLAKSLFGVSCSQAECSVAPTWMLSAVWFNFSSFSQKKNQNQLCIVRYILLQPVFQCKTSEVKVLASVGRGNLLIPSLECHSVLRTLANSYFQAVLTVCWCFLIVVQMESRAEAWREGLELTASALIKWPLFSSFGILRCHSWGVQEQYLRH